MSDYIIATSSTCDLPAEWLESHGVPFIRYTFTINDRVLEDDCRDETRAELFQAMRDGDLLKTSMINEYSYQEFFRQLMESGKDVIYLDMAEKISVSYQNSLRAAEAVREEFPERKLYVMDTRCISGGLGFLVAHSVRMAEAGAGFDEVIAWGESNKLKIAHRFTVDDLKYLSRSGRVSNASALIGSVLNIKPVLYVPDAGTLDVAVKCRGRKKALQTILNGIRSDWSGVDAKGREMLILHADCQADAEFVKAEVEKMFPDAGEVRISSLGVVIGAHVGPGLLAAFYLCDSRTPG